MSKMGYWWTFSGAKFGELTVLGPVDTNHRTFAARCTCGREITRYGPDLVHYKSCGHLNKGHPNYIKQTPHERFGDK